MDFYKDFPERSDAGTATTPDGGIVAGSDKLNDNDYAMIGANGTGSNSQGKGYKVKFSSIYNYLKSKLLGDSGMEATSERRGLLSTRNLQRIGNDVGDNRAGKYIMKMFFFDTIATQQKKYIIMSEYSSGRKLRGNFNTTITLAPCMNTDTNGACGFVHTWAFDGVSYKAIGAISRLAGISICEFTYLGARYRGVELNIHSYSLAGVNVEGLVYDPDVVNIVSESDVSSVSTIGVFTDIAPQSSLAASYIAERYAPDEEQALTRRMIANDPTVVEQFEAYNAYCEECKAKAKEELANQPQVLPADSLDAQQ